MRQWYVVIDPDGEVVCAGKTRKGCIHKFMWELGGGGARSWIGWRKKGWCCRLAREVPEATR